jgi:hypothetical protein
MLHSDQPIKHRLIVSEGVWSDRNEFSDQITFTRSHILRRSDDRSLQDPLIIRMPPKYDDGTLRRLNVREMLDGLRDALDVS